MYLQLWERSPVFKIKIKNKQKSKKERKEIKKKHTPNCLSVSKWFLHRWSMKIIFIKIFHLLKCILKAKLQGHGGEVVHLPVHSTKCPQWHGMCQVQVRSQEASQDSPRWSPELGHPSLLAGSWTKSEAVEVKLAPTGVTCSCRQLLTHRSQCWLPVIVLLPADVTRPLKLSAHLHILLPCTELDIVNFGASKCCEP